MIELLGRDVMSVHLNRAANCDGAGFEKGCDEFTIKQHQRCSRIVRHVWCRVDGCFGGLLFQGSCGWPSSRRACWVRADPHVARSAMTLFIRSGLALSPACSLVTPSEIPEPGSEVCVYQPCHPVCVLLLLERKNLCVMVSLQISASESSLDFVLHF